ncbi:class I SAM-dependent methyltransferase [Chlorogloeopsis sp. ULAP01]|uniref:O-methyltransferase n=1 Tax=Chlorogloeopsis sp. ULAP01 TaxID=3056483 RepID=UPI0025AAFE66|nr:class I SAM-dependent methyltransferase [Chlorogloeopsis sp. ULAP01]MDM9379244.1 class I SAM-dependent methyltransferase [Chlorogloeopsis sp. ULAP01]
MEYLTQQVCSLRCQQVYTVLSRLHDAARGDRWRFLQLLPQVIAGRLAGKQMFEILTPQTTKNLYIPISREQGKFLYLMARSVGAKRVVEFGTSFGVSTIYLAAAVRDNQGEVVVGTEFEPSKHERAVANLAEAGLSQVTDIRLGDALETLRDVPEPVDLVLLDGWKDLYIPILELLKPKLRSGSVVLADNIFTFKKTLRPYVEYMRSGKNGFESMTLTIGAGFEYSYYVG